MDSMIPTGQKNTLAEYMILYGADNRPPMYKDLVAKDLWEKVQLLMQCTSLTKQERECKLYDAFDKFTRIKGESLHLLPPKWSKFVTDVKLVKDLHTTNFDQLYAYLKQHELHGNEVRLTRKRNQDPLALVHKGLSSVLTAKDKVIWQDNAQSQRGKRDATWFREKVLLVEAQGNGKILTEEDLEFLADLGIVEGPISQSVIKHNAAYQADDLDAYDSDCDEISTAKAVLMANLSSYGSYVLSEVPFFENTNNDMLNQSVQEMTYSEPSQFVEHPD
ncbi:hypothetical protein Tco_0448712 [Tanacetum coccineum]